MTELNKIIGSSGNREISIQPEMVQEETRTLELAFSSEAPVERWFGTEVLDHDPGSIKLDRLVDGAPLLLQHDPDKQIGVIESARIDSDKVGRAIVRFSKSALAEEILQDIRDGIRKKVSVGYRIWDAIEQDDGETYRVKTEPHEISIVSIPADSSVGVGRNLTLEPEVTTMTETVKDKTEQRAEVPTEPVKVEKVNIEAERAQAIKAERERVTQIRSFANNFKDRVNPETIDALIHDGKTFDEARAEILMQITQKIDSETSRADVSVTSDEKDKFIEQGVQALRARAGLEKMDGSNSFRGMRLTEVAKECLGRAGVSARGLSELEMVKRAFTTSTSDFPILLENTMHKTLQAAYAIAPDTWSRFCATGSVSDFRAHNRYRTGSFGNLDQVNELAEYVNKSIPDGEKESISAVTKGNVINISRQTIINDDLGAFIGLANMLGRAARRTIESDVYALLASNPTMSDGIALFHASHGNLAGSGAVVSIATVEAARQAMAQQMDVSGNDYLDLRPSVWVGGMSAGATAREINAQEYNDEATKNQRKPNIVRGLFRDVVDTPRISGTEWYLFADSMDAPVIEVAFLNGEQVPFLDSMEGFNVDGLQWKVRLDYGIAAVDWRGAYKNAGA